MRSCFPSHAREQLFIWQVNDSVFLFTWMPIRLHCFYTFIFNLSSKWSPNTARFWTLFLVPSLLVCSSVFSHISVCYSTALGLWLLALLLTHFVVITGHLNCSVQLLSCIKHCVQQDRTNGASVLSAFSYYTMLAPKRL